MNRVSIILGSDSDIEIYLKIASVLDDFGVPFERRILSAQRTPGHPRRHVAQAEPSLAEKLETFRANQRDAVPARDLRERGGG